MTAPDAPLQTPDLQPRLERCRRVVDEMAEAGMRLIRALDPDAPGADIRALALAYGRISRAVRLSLMLDLRLDALARGGVAALVAEQALAVAAEARETEVESEAEPSEPTDPSEGRRMSLDREAPDEALRDLKRPLGDLVDAICKGLILSPAATEAAKAPFTALIANDDDPDDPEARAAPVRPDRAPNPRNRFKARLMAGTVGARGYARGP